MRILAVDDERMALESLLEALEEVLPNEEIHSFIDADEALEFANNNDIDIAFLDIKMRGITGIELAKKIKDIHPNTNIVFTTGYTSYAVSAFGVQASDYLLKPIEADQIKKALANLRTPIKHNANRVRVKCFGTFEVFIDDNPVTFKRQKTKELFAYLIDRVGANCTMGQLMTALWEDGEDNSSRQSNLRNLIADLKSTFNEYGIDNVINKNKNTISVFTNNIDCDFYDFMNYKPYAVNSYRGEYMSQYSWAEITLAKINKFSYITKHLNRMPRNT